MPQYLYHPSPIDILYPGSEYQIEGYMNVVYGAGEFTGELTTSDVSSVIASFSVFGLMSQWIYFNAPFSVSNTTLDPILRFGFDGQVVTEVRFDEIKLKTFEEWREEGVIQIYPDFKNYARKTIKNKSDHRTQGGKLYSYKWGDYERFEIPLSYVANSKASIINSWWTGDSTILLKINSGGVWETNSLTFVNKKEPLSARAKPYPEYWNGMLELETL